MYGNLAVYEPYSVISNKDKTTKVRVVYYGRVSTQHEAQVNAFENQIDFYAEILKRHPNWELVGSYDDKGITGTMAIKRPGFMKMISDAQKGEFDLIITREVSRFARNTVDSLAYTRQLKNHGVEVYFVNDNIWSLDSEVDFRLAIMSALSEQESIKISSRVSAGQKISQQKGVLYGNGNILGYSYVKAIKSIDNTYEIVEEEAETVRMIYEMYVYKYMGAKAIATELQRLGRKNASGKCKWDATRVLRILKNRTYAGYLAYNKSVTVNLLEHRRIAKKDNEHKYVKGNFPAIISDELYNKAQAIRCRKLNHCEGGARKGKAISRDKWASKLVCSCGYTFKKFVWRKNKKDGEKQYGYSCWNIINNKSKAFREEHNLESEGYCNISSISDWKFDMMFSMILERLWENPQNTVNVLVNEIRDNYTEESFEDVNKTRLVREHSRNKARLDQLVEMRLDGSISNEDFIAKQNQLKTKLEQIEKEMEANKEIVTVEKTEDVSQVISRISGILEDMCDLSKKEADEKLVDCLIRRITPTEGGVYKWYFKGEHDDEEYKFSEDNYIMYERFVINFKKARAYRKKFGNYLREKQYSNITVEVYLRK